MARAKRLLTLAYKAHQRNEAAIAGRIVSLAFAAPDSAQLFETISAAEENPEEDSDETKAEAVLRSAEATTTGGIFTATGVNTLLAIAEKAHKDGLPKVAKLIAEVAS